MFRLAIIIGSTRPGRVGPTLAGWLAERATNNFEVDLVDLAEVALPLLDEPHHPRLRNYTHEHTIAWSQRIEAADAVVLVSPEYNFAMPPALVNAIDYLHQEWRYLPVGLMTYGGVSGGLRAAQMIKQLVTSVRMVPIVEAITVPMVGQYLHEGVFTPSDQVVHSSGAMLAELHKMTKALSPLRREPR